MRSVFEATEETLDWWRTYIAADEEALDALFGLRARLDTGDQLKELQDDLDRAANNCGDMESQPAAMLPVVQEWNARLDAIDSIREAITRSIGYNEIVRVIVSDITAALAVISPLCADYDHTDGDGGENVWGTDNDGSEFRLLLVEAA